MHKYTKSPYTKMGCNLSSSMQSKEVSPSMDLRTVILIQTWYRRYRARLEARRRCAWMIYNSLEYVGEQNHVKLYSLFKDLMNYADQQQTPSEESKSCATKTVTSSQAWNLVSLPSVSQKYRGPCLKFPLDMQQIHEVIEQFNGGHKLHPRYILQLLEESRQILLSRSNITRASTSIAKQITVVGDLHGQFADLQTILHKNGLPDITNPYIFNGDLVDRGRNSVETAVTILMFLVVSPKAVLINRGNHEDHYVNCQYGFVKELQRKYKTNAGRLIVCFSEVFRLLPLATIIDDKVFVCHGGISSNTDLEKLNQLPRQGYVTFLRSQTKNTITAEDHGQVLDILWSDPRAARGCAPNQQRGVGCWFGPDITDSFLHKNKLETIIRSHECKPDGFEWTHSNKVLTLFSASNYYTEDSNRGAYAKLERNHKIHIVQYVTRSSSRRFHTLSQRVNIAEEAALLELRRKICEKSGQLLAEFSSKDKENTGHISPADWCSVMEHVMDLKLPWRTLQPQLSKNDISKKLVDYKSTFEKLSVSNRFATSSSSVAEELYKHRDVLETIFRMIDTDNSGHITLQEFQDACMKLPGRHFLDEESISDMVRSIDFNKDGQIDFNEFLEAFRLVEIDHQRRMGDS